MTVLAMGMMGPDGSLEGGTEKLTAVSYSFLGHVYAKVWLVVSSCLLRLFERIGRHVIAGCRPTFQSNFKVVLVVVGYRDNLDAVLAIQGR